MSKSFAKSIDTSGEMCYNNTVIKKRLQTGRRKHENEAIDITAHRVVESPRNERRGYILQCIEYITK